MKRGLKYGSIAIGILIILSSIWFFFAGYMSGYRNNEAMGLIYGGIGGIIIGITTLILGYKENKYSWLSILLGLGLIFLILLYWG